jgi:hypothetical protein
VIFDLLVPTGTAAVSVKWGKSEVSFEGALLMMDSSLVSKAKSGNTIFP